jgi:hypothetical protein
VTEESFHPVLQNFQNLSGSRIYIEIAWQTVPFQLRERARMRALRVETGIFLLHTTKQDPVNG